MKQCLVCILFTLHLSLSGCATSVDVPLNRFESPEIQKHLKIKVDAGVQKQASAVLSSDFTYYPPNTTNPRLKTDHEITGSGGLGLFDQVEIGLRVPAEITIKYQPIGDRKSDAKAGNFSLALIAGWANQSRNQTGRTLFSSTTYTIDLKQSYTDFGLITGYRFSELLLLYGGYNRIDCNFSGTYTENTTPRNIAGSMILNAAHLGFDIRLSTSVTLKLEGVGGNLKYNHSQTKALYGIGAVISFYQL